MRRLLILLLALLAVLLFASAATAQEGGTHPYFTQGRPRFTGEGYEVYKDGTFVIGGDVVGDCGLLLQEVQATGRAPSSELLREVEVCTKAGFPPPGSDALPDTGGPPFLIVAAALLLCIYALGSLGVRR